MRLHRYLRISSLPPSLTLPHKGGGNRPSLGLCDEPPHTPHPPNPRRDRVDRAVAHTDHGADRRREAVATVLLLHRSEEHTSELQSRSDLVCRLLLEKKKKTDEDLNVVAVHDDDHDIDRRETSPPENVHADIGIPAHNGQPAGHHNSRQPQLHPVTHLRPPTMRP